VCSSHNNTGVYVTTYVWYRTAIGEDAPGKSMEWGRGKLLTNKKNKNKKSFVVSWAGCIAG